MSGVLEEARRLGYLGPGPVEAHMRHAQGFRAAAETQPESVVDLGSGAGIPGLVLALAWPGSEFLLIDANHNRADFLRKAVRKLGLGPRVIVLQARAEDVGREQSYRAAAELVVARAFGPPAVVAECAAPLLRVGGHLVVSEPPAGSGDRWPEDGLAPLGLAPQRLVKSQQGRFQVLAQVSPCPARFPRRSGLPAKRPLFSLCPDG